MTATEVPPTKLSPAEIAERRIARRWAVTERAGVPQAREALQSALDRFDEAQAQKRGAESTVSVFRDEHDDAIATASWTLAGRFAVHANKTYMADDTDHVRSFTAPEKKEWIERQVAVDDEVKATASLLREATETLDEAKDRIASCERRCQACRHDLDAAVAVLATLTTALTGGD